MYALAIRLVQQVGKGKAMIEKLRSLGLSLSEKQEKQMLDEAYPFYEYDLLGILKSAFVPKIYVDAVTYMPTRNTPRQLARLRKLCDDYSMFQISGEDINSPPAEFYHPGHGRSPVPKPDRRHLEAH